MAPPPRLPPRLRKTSLLAADPTPLSCLLASRAATKDRRAAPPLHRWHVVGLSLCSSQDRAHLLTRKRLPREKSPSEQAQAQVVFIPDFPNSLFSLCCLRTTRQSNGSAPDPSAPPTAANPSEEAFCSTRHHQSVTLSTTFPLTNTSVYSLEFCNIEPREIHHLHTLSPCQYCMNAISLSPPQLLP